MKLARLLVLGVAALFIVVLAGGWTLYKRSPTYTLKEIQAAIEERNRLKFERYVDLDRIAETMVDEIIAQTTLAGMGESRSGFAAIGAMLGAGVADRLKPALKSTFRATVLKAVESGRMDSIFGAPADTASRQIDLALVARNTGANETKFLGLTGIERHEDVATVGFRLRNEILDTTLALRWRMERHGNRWKFVAPDNLADYLSDISLLQEKHLTAANQAVRESLAEMVQMGGLKRRVREYRYASDDLILELQVENLSTDTIKAVIIELYGPDGKIEGDAVSLGYLGNLLPGAKGTARRVIDYNRFIDRHVTLRYSNSLEPRILGVVVRRGDEEEMVVGYANWAEYLERMH